MITTGQITYCVRTCTRARRHLPDCTTEQCGGCQPRQAERGRLCLWCHQQLQLMLTDAPHVVDWLDVHLPRGTAQGKARTDAELRRGTTAPPAPVDLDVIELTQTWKASLSGWVTNLMDDANLTHGPSARYTPMACARYLLVWLPTITTMPWVEDLWEELSWLTRDSHKHVPWSPEVRRVHGIPCPECHTCALVVYGGQSDVTCQHCRLVIPEHRYGIWTRMLADEHQRAQETA